MTVYVIIFVFLLSMALLDFVVKKDKVYDYIYIGFSMFFFFIAAFRGMGNDYDGYMAIFYDIKDHDWIDIFNPEYVYVEPLYATLNILLGDFPYQTVLFVVAGLNIAILFPFIRRYSPYPYATLLFFAGMFMYTGIMGIIRQHLAAAICLWAMAALSEPKSNRRFWWLVIIAIFIHYSAIFVILVRFIKDSYYSTKTYIVVLLLAIASNVMFYEAFKIVAGMMPQVIAWKLEIYMNSEEGTRFGLNAALAIRLFTFGLAYFNKDKIIAAFPRYGALFVNIYFLAIIIYTGFGFLPQVAARGAVYFHYMELFVIPMVLYVSNNFNRTWIFIIFALFSLWRQYEMVTVYAEAYMPYKNVLFSPF